MILFTILLIMLLIIAAITVMGIGVLGSVGVVVFSDLIVCIVLIVWLIKKFVFKK